MKTMSIIVKRNVAYFRKEACTSSTTTNHIIPVFQLKRSMIAILSTRISMIKSADSFQLRSDL